MPIDKDFLGYLSLVVAFASYIPYVVSTIRGHTKPHVFSWIIWGLVTAIVFVAQTTENAGPGGWATGFSAFFLLLIAALGFHYGEKQRTRGDWIAFLATLSAIPLWYVTKNPLWSVLLVTTIDVVAYYPTLRKSWHKPKEEMALKYILTAVKYCASLMALQHYSLITVVYPLASLVMELAVIILLFLRRRQLRAVI
ncbi:MAG: hypothetical protein ACK4NR_05095 [Micavibrio sp.]